MENNGWQQIPDAPEGDVRCIETGIEIRAIGNGWRWEVLYPMWRRSDRKVMRTGRIFTTKIEALGHATRAARPAMRAAIAIDHAEALQAADWGVPPATDTEIAQASRYATGLRARILKRLQVAEARVAELEARLK